MEQSLLLSIEDQKDREFFEQLKDFHPRVVDFYRNQLEELTEINNPVTQADKFERGQKVKVDEPKEEDGKWAYFPWNNTLVHILDKEDYRKVRLSRNFNLITPEEQERFTSSRIAIAGLNVGHPGAICIALEGGSENIKLTDFDTLSLSNLNRFRAGICELGVNKSTLTERQILEIDPYYKVENYDKGLNAENIEKFLLEPKVDLLIEEMDNMPLKIKVREIARANKIPVLMVTGSGPGLVIDVERYDLNNSTPLLNGYLPQEVQDRVFRIRPGQSMFSELITLLKDFMGEQYLHPRLITSFAEVGKSLVGIPQISESSFLRGAMLCFFSRMILTNDDKIQSGRYNFSPEDLKVIS